MTRGRSICRRVVMALPLVPLSLLLMAGVAFAQQVEVSPNSAPDSSKCSLSAPSPQCGQWTFWASLGALVIGAIVVVLFVVRYLRDAPRFQIESDGRPTGAARSQPARPLAPPPAPTATAAAPVSASQAPAAQAPAATEATSAVAVAEPPPVASEAATAPAAASPAGEAPARRPPSPRQEPVEPDQATFDRVLAEQLAKGTDRRVAEGRAKAAALKAAREKAEG